MRIKGFISKDVAEKGWNATPIGFVAFRIYKDVGMSRDCEPVMIDVPCTIVVGDSLEDELAAALKAILKANKNPLERVAAITDGYTALERYEKERR